MQDKFPKPLTPFPIRDKFKKKKKGTYPTPSFYPIDCRTRVLQNSTTKSYL